MKPLPVPPPNQPATGDTAPRGGRLLRRVGVVLSSNLVARGLAFVFFVLAARWLSEADYGVVRSTIAWATLLCFLPAPFSLAWSRVLAAEHTPEGQQAQTRAGLAAFAVLFMITLALSMVWLLLSPQVGPSALMVTMGLAVLYAAEGYFKGRMAFRRLAAYLLTGNLAQLATMALIFLIRPDLLSAPLVLLIYGLAYLLPLLGFVRPARLPWRSARPSPAHDDGRPTTDDPDAPARRTSVAHRPPPRPPAGVGRTALAHISRRSIWALIHITLGLVLVNSANTVLLNIDLVLVGYFVDERSLGYYTVAKTMLAPVLVLAQSLFAVLLPMNVRETGDRRRIARAVAMIGAGTLLLTAVAAALAGLLVGPIFGARYLPAAPVFQVLCFGGWFYLMLALFASFTLGQGHDWRARIAYGIGALAALGLLAALVPPFGIVGAAWAFTLACAVGALIVGVDWARSVRA